MYSFKQNVSNRWRNFIVMTVLLDPYFACEGSDMSPLKQSEIGDQNLRVTLYYIALQNFGVNNFWNC